MICYVRLGVLCWSAVQRSMQCVADMTLHRSYCVASSTAAAQVVSAVTKVTNPVMFNGKFPNPPSREAWKISLPGISRTGIPGNFLSHGNSPGGNLESPKTLC